MGAGLPDPGRRALLAALGALLACGGWADPAPYATERTPPWSEMALPLDGGRVVYSEEAMLTVHYDGGSVDALTAQWTRALVDAGLSPGADTSGEDMRSITFSGPDAVIALGLWARAGRVEVALTRYPRSR